MKTLHRNGTSIACRISGSGRPWLLFVHGSCIDQGYWAAQAAHFSKTHTVVTLDLPGHRASGRERTQWSLQAWAKDLSFVIREL